MSATREIVTIQSGNYSNFIGTHWWNLQESSFCYVPGSSIPLDINHDILFREGENFKKEVTYTPRLVVVDLKGNPKSLKMESSLYTNPDNRTETLWDGTIDVIRQEPRRQNPFLEEMERANTSSNICDTDETKENSMQEISDMTYNFESYDTVWSDFLKAGLHPRSYCFLDDLRSTADENPLEMYKSGEEAYVLETKEMIQESLRKTTEECDYLQGFQLIFDAHNGFSGITNGIFQHIDDEYHSKSSFGFPVFQNEQAVEDQVRKVQMHRLYSILVSMSNLNNHCSIFSPLALTDNIVALDGPYRKFPYLQYDENLMYHSSAILAAGIETLTSQYRLKSTKFHLSDIAESMSVYGRKLISSSISLPFPMNEDLYLSTMIDNSIPEYHMTSLTPFFNFTVEKTLMQHAILRGIPQTKFFSSQKSSYHGLSPEELFGQYLNNYSASSVTAVSVFDEKCSVANPFPNIFNSTVGTNGYLSAMPRPPNKCVSQIPSSGSLSNSDSASEFLESLLMMADKKSFKSYVKSMDPMSDNNDDFLEVVQNVMGLQDNYKNY